MVVSQQTAEALTALDLTVALTNFFIRLDDLVAKALVISFLVIMKKELANGPLGDMVANIRQASLDPVKAPTWVFFGQSQYEVHDDLSLLALRFQQGLDLDTLKVIDLLLVVIGQGSQDRDEELSRLQNKSHLSQFLHGSPGHFHGD